MRRVILGSFSMRDDGEAPALLDRYYEAGGRELDLANVYGEGEANVAVGKWLRGRDDVVLYAKGCHPPFCSPSLVSEEVDRARTPLGAEKLDVFVLHRDDLSLPVSAWAEALVAERERGTIGGFGVSNWTLDRYRELAEHVDVAVFSNHFSLADLVEAPWPGCLANTRDELSELDGTMFLAWSSLAAGYFAGLEAPSWDSPANRGRRDRATELGRELGTSPTAVALAYVLHQGEHVRPVVGTRSTARLDELLAAESIRLSPEQLAWLESG
jgi:aryl-alcohol dehydrogenase-like predicted oxidoreductase